MHRQVDVQRKVDLRVHFGILFERRAEDEGAEPGLFAGLFGVQGDSGQGYRRGQASRVRAHDEGLKCGFGFGIGGLVRWIHVLSRRCLRLISNTWRQMLVTAT